MLRAIAAAKKKNGRIDARKLADCKRNTFLVAGHHPLRETLVAQTGATEELQKRYLQQQYDNAKKLLIHEWSPAEELEAAF